MLSKCAQLQKYQAVCLLLPHVWFFLFFRCERFHRFSRETLKISENEKPNYKIITNKLMNLKKFTQLSSQKPCRKETCGTQKHVTWSLEG